MQISDMDGNRSDWDGLASARLHGNGKLVSQEALPSFWEMRREWSEIFFELSALYLGIAGCAIDPDDRWADFCRR